MKTRISLLLIIVGLLAASCKDFLNVNTDPNNPTEVSPDLVLPVGLNYTAVYEQQDRGLNHLGNMMMFNFGESNGFSWYDQEFKYNATSTFYDQMFDDAYSRSLKQYNILVNRPEGYYKAIGMIMEAYHFQILVDLYGDIPYSEALERGKKSNPKYDKGEEVYNDLLTKLSTAIATIDSTSNAESSVKVGDDDTVFGGDMSKWKAFANTLKIRILTRLSDTKPASFINDELAKISNSGAGYITDDVTINPGYEKEQEGKQNPYWNQLGVNASGTETLSYKATCATQFVINFFQNTNDTTRLGAIFQEDPSGYKGINQGQPNNSDDQTPDYVSNLKLGGGVLKSATMGSAIFTLAEHELNLAELAFKGFNVSGSAQSHYEAGIQASFDYLGASGASSYYTNGKENVDWNNSSNKMDAIMTQKWLATMGITAEQAWFDYNRTGYPDAKPVGVSTGPTAPTGFPLSAQAGSNKDRPVRLHYPASEITRNGSNVPDQPDPFTQKIFWAQ